MELANEVYTYLVDNFTRDDLNGWTKYCFTISAWAQFILHHSQAAYEDEDIDNCCVWPEHLGKEAGYSVVKASGGKWQGFYCFLFVNP